MNLTVTLNRQPSADDCATAMRLIFVFAGPDVFRSAVEKLPDVAGFNDDDAIAAAGFGAAPSAPIPTPPAPVGAAASAPIVPPAPVVPAGVVTLDSTGLPWDARIHAETRGTNQNGSWKRRRNVDDAAFNAVVAELRASHPAPAAAAPAAPAVPAAPTPPAASGELPEYLRRTPDAPAAPAAPTPPAAPGAVTFTSLMQTIGTHIQGKKLTMPEVNAFCASLGFESITAMNKADNKAEYFPIVLEMVNNHVAGK